MLKPSSDRPEWESTREKLMGLGETSIRKSYYPGLQQQMRELQSSEERFRTIFDRINDAIFVHDAASGAILDINERCSKMFGYSREELLHLSVGDLSSGHHPYTQENALRLISKAVAGEPQMFEWQSKHKSGRLFWTEANLLQVVINGEERVLVVLRDVTERHQAEEALRQSEERLSLTLDATTEGIYDWNIVTGEVFLSPSWYRSLGYSPSEIENDVSSWKSLIHPEDRHLAFETLENHLAGKTHVYEHEYRIRKNDGTYRWFLDRGKVVKRNPDEKPIRMVGSNIDITERKQAEEERKALETYKRTFFRDTILSVTDGKLEICDADQIQPYLASAQVVTLVSNKSDVNSARKLMEQTCIESGLEMKQVETFTLGFGEAITNAIKHAPEGFVYAGHTEDDVWVAVVDNGPGIESLILPRAVLKRGFSTKTSMGLGYSIMLDVADHIILKTDSGGTSVILIKKKQTKKETLLVLPDTWNSIPDSAPQ